jgi:hypothetical protein
MKTKLIVMLGVLILGASATLLVSASQVRFAPPAHARNVLRASTQQMVAQWFEENYHLTAPQDLMAQVARWFSGSTTFPLHSEVISVEIEAVADFKNHVISRPYFSGELIFYTTHSEFRHLIMDDGTRLSFVVTIKSIVGTTCDSCRENGCGLYGFSPRSVPGLHQYQKSCLCCEFIFMEAKR